MKTRFIAVAALAVAGFCFASAALAEQVRVNNLTSTVLYRLYFSETSNNSWGPDQLGSSVVQPGGAVVITIPGGRNCSFDFLMEYADGVRDTHTMNVCNTSTLNLYD